MLHFVLCFFFCFFSLSRSSMWVLMWNISSLKSETCSLFLDYENMSRWASSQWVGASTRLKWGKSWFELWFCWHRGGEERRRNQSCREGSILGPMASSYMHVVCDKLAPIRRRSDTKWSCWDMWGTRPPSVEQVYDISSQKQEVVWGTMYGPGAGYSLRMVAFTPARRDL